MDYFKKMCFQNEDTEKWAMNRPRMGTLQDAMAYDAKTINELLNRGDEAAKCAIAHIIMAMQFEYVESNKITNDFETYLKSYYGENKFQEAMNTWLIAKSNEFFENVGMSEAKKPISKIIMFPKGEK